MFTDRRQFFDGLVSVWSCTVISVPSSNSVSPAWMPVSVDSAATAGIKARMILFAVG